MRRPRDLSLLLAGAAVVPAVTPALVPAPPIVERSPAPTARRREVELEAEAALRRTLSSDPDPAARRAALDRWTHDRADPEPVLRVLFTDPDPLVRRWAALALERDAAADLAPALRQALAAERDAAVRSILTRVTRRLGPS